MNKKNSIVITESTALKFFGSTDVIGKRLDVADNPDSLFASFTITGVAKNPPANSSIQFDVLIPFSYLQMMFNDNNWLAAYLGTFVIINPHTDLKKIEQEFQSIHNSNGKDQISLGISSGEFNKHTSYWLQPITDIHLNPYYSSSKSREGGSYNGSNPVFSYFLLGISLFILFMASINFINLNIGNSLTRAKEIGVRKISGSNRRQIIFQFLIESSIPCLAALCLAFVLTQSLLPFLNQLADRQIAISSMLSWKLFYYIFALLLLNILMAGLYPAILLSRFRPSAVLYNKSKLRGSNWFGKALVVLQFTIAICLIISSLIYYRQMDFIRTKDLGYNPNNILRIDIPPRRDSKAIYSIFKNELAKVPGIKQVSLEARADAIKVLTEKNEIVTNYRMIEASYLPMLELALKEGRNFSDLFGTDKGNAVIVNETFVTAAGLKKPLGAQVQIKDFYKKEATIIGIVKDYHIGSLKESIQPLILGINNGLEGTMLIKIDKRHQQNLITILEKIYHTAIPGAAFSYTFWDQLNAKEYEQERKLEKIILVATILSILICCLGLLGLTHLITHLRVKEIGIRKVLGSGVAGIITLLSKDFLKLVILAILVASPIAGWIMSQWLQQFAYRVDIGSWTFLLAGAVALIIAMITLSFQSIKAAIANPVKSLRSE